MFPESNKRWKLGLSGTGDGFKGKLQVSGQGPSGSSDHCVLGPNVTTHSEENQEIVCI